MSPGPTFDRVYAALKAQLVGGRFAPGDRLEPAVIGETLAASITPVRDALHRLVGERMVEAPRHNGFRVPSFTEAELRDLYGWNQQVVDAALRHSLQNMTPLPELITADPAEIRTAAQLFLAIGSMSGSAEQQAAIAALNDRLGLMRRAEEQLIDDRDEELARLAHALRLMDRTALRRGIAAYHRRRQRMTPDLLVAARRMGEAGTRTSA